MRKGKDAKRRIAMLGGLALFGAAIAAAQPSAPAAGDAGAGPSATAPTPTQVAHMSLGPVSDTKAAKVRLYGRKGLNLARVVRHSLRLRTKGPGLISHGKRHFAFRLTRDVNDDGFRDARVRFKVNLVNRIEAGYAHAQVSGVVRSKANRVSRAADTNAKASGTTSTGTSFVASDSLVTSGASSDYCSVGSDGYYVRCAFTTSFDQLPVYLGVLVEDLNSDLSDAGYDFEITSSDSVQVELFGGAGADGSDEKKCAYNTGDTSFGGSGGDRGYAQSAQTLSALEALGSGEAAGALYVYVGQDGPSSQNGGSSSMLLAKSILEVTDVQDPASETFVGIAGGGGGGGAAASYSAFPVGCRNGHSGGDGGVAVATATASVPGAGQDGHDGKDGEGGSDSTSTADDGGQPGVGGFSVDDDGTDNGWAGSSITLDDWSHGYGGTSGNDGGGGGGFGGGGHGNKDGRNYSGGGGAGSWALQNSVATDSTFQVGQEGYDEPSVILTFQTSPTS